MGPRDFNADRYSFGASAMSASAAKSRLDALFPEGREAFNCVLFQQDFLNLVFMVEYYLRKSISGVRGSISKWPVP